VNEPLDIPGEAAVSAGVLPDIPTPLLTVVAGAGAGPEDSGAMHVVLVDEAGEQRGSEDRAVDGELIARLGATGASGEVHALPDGRWLLGTGEGGEADWRRAGAALATALRLRPGRGSGRVEPADRHPPPAVALVVTELAESSRAALVTGLLLGSHQFRVTARPGPRPGRALLVAPEPELARLRDTVEVATALASATALARDLASAPSDVKTPVWLVETAARLVEEIPGLTATIWSSARLAEEGFGGVLAVGGGSARAPAMVRLDWSPVGGAPRDARHLVLVGKGITFDTGGISIKPAEGMHLMRTDMAGGAAVIGAMLAIARLGVPMRVTGLVPAAENHVSGSAYRPGDVVRHYDGRTTEVVNTDAEGRMVLADAIGYAVRELSPDLIVDVATLTGAMKVALGLRTGGLLASDDELADAVMAAAARAGERLWRMPLLDHVAQEISSPIADVRQAPPGPGGIGAAVFLREFTGQVPWAHLDIAGPARCEQPYDEVAIGATGFAARTLVELALGYTRD
jgi:leucyl aminopeptidase